MAAGRRKMMAAGLQEGRSEVACSAGKTVAVSWKPEEEAAAEGCCCRVLAG